MFQSIPVLLPPLLDMALASKAMQFGGSASSTIHSYWLFCMCCKGSILTSGLTLNMLSWTSLIHISYALRGCFHCRGIITSDVVCTPATQTISIELLHHNSRTDTENGITCSLGYPNPNSAEPKEYSLVNEAAPNADMLMKHPLRSREACEAPASDLIIQSVQLGLQNGTGHSIHLCDPVCHLVQPVLFGERRKCFRE